MTRYDLDEIKKSVILDIEQQSNHYKISDLCDNDAYIDAYTEGVIDLSAEIESRLEEQPEELANLSVEELKFYVACLRKLKLQAELEKMTPEQVELVLEKAMELQKA